MLTKTDLETLAQVRLDDSLFLLQAGRSSSAYYLAGYAVELALKACISKLIQTNVIPEKAFINAIYTHTGWTTYFLPPDCFPLSTQTLRLMLNSRHTGQSQVNGQRRAAMNSGIRCLQQHYFKQSMSQITESFNG